MFIDYYAILKISFDANAETIKAAYKTQALKWHPDRNPGVDTTQRMQQINEAYLILKDTEARQRYDKEYQRYKEYQRQTSASKEQRQYQRQQQESQSQTKREQQKTYSETFEDSSYEVFDETLNNWMSNARKQAVKLAKQTIDDIIGMSKESGKAMGEAALAGVVRYIVFGIIMLIIFKACH
jgi:curved DNA-binding protein CbpA